VEDSKLRDFSLFLSPYLSCGLIYGISIFIFELFIEYSGFQSEILSQAIRSVIFMFILLSLPLIGLILGIFSGFAKSQSNELDKLIAFFEGVIGAFVSIFILSICIFLLLQFDLNSISENAELDLEFIFTSFNAILLLSIICGASSFSGNLIGEAYQKRFPKSPY